MCERAETFGFHSFGDVEIVLLLPIGSIYSETIPVILKLVKKVLNLH